MSNPDRFEIRCGCLGCQAPATTIVLHGEYGRRAVCDGHADGQEVLADA